MCKLFGECAHFNSGIVVEQPNVKPAQIKSNKGVFGGVSPFGSVCLDTTIARWSQLDSVRTLERFLCSENTKDPVTRTKSLDTLCPSTNIKKKKKIERQCGK